MDALAIYAITAGGILIGLFLTRALSIIASWSNLFSVLYSRHLSLPFVVHRHQLWDPWTRASLFLHISYVAVNVFLVFFHTQLLADAGRRAGELALINLIFPLSTIHLSYLADLLGITWRTCRRIHRATGWLAIAMLLFHIVATLQAREFSFPFCELPNLFTVLVCFIVGAIVILFWLIFYRGLPRWVSLLCLRYDGFIDGRIRSFSEAIKSLQGSSSTAPGNIF
jgi:hypothetical protein